MALFEVHRIIHRRDPFTASDAADDAGRATRTTDAERTAFFAEREVINTDGTFPFGEGFLYSRDNITARAPDWPAGDGKPTSVCAEGHKGSKLEQQDAFVGACLRIGGHDGAVVAVADGVSASGPLAARAARTAVGVFMTRVREELQHVPAHEAKRHPFIEKAIERAAFAANFEVIRQVLFDSKRDGEFDAGDRDRLRGLGVDLPVGALTVAQMQQLAPRLEAVVKSLEELGVHALTTLAVAVAVDNDLYTFSTGDAVVGLYRSSRPAGRKFIHLTNRDQTVVELFREDADPREHADVYQNEITACLGDTVVLTGTLRRYPNLLEPGDRVVACSDGLGPRDGGGLDRDAIESTLEAHPGPDAAEALVNGQIADLDPEKYQDNVGVVVLRVE